jgi:hypothetical protein
LVGLTFFTFSVLTFSFFTFSFFTFSFFTAGPASASFASRLASLAAPAMSFLVFWCCRLAFNIDEWDITTSDGGRFDCSLNRLRDPSQTEAGWRGAVGRPARRRRSLRGLEAGVGIEPAYTALQAAA